MRVCAVFKHVMNVLYYVYRSQMLHREPLIFLWWWSVRVFAKKRPAWWPWMENTPRNFVSYVLPSVKNVLPGAPNLKMNTVSNVRMNAKNVPPNARQCKIPGKRAGSDTSCPFSCKNTYHHFGSSWPEVCYLSALAGRGRSVVGASFCASAIFSL